MAEEYLSLAEWLLQKEVAYQTDDELIVSGRVPIEEIAGLVQIVCRTRGLGFMISPDVDLVGRRERYPLTALKATTTALKLDRVEAPRAPETPDQHRRATEPEDLGTTPDPDGDLDPVNVAEDHPDLTERARLKAKLSPLSTNEPEDAPEPYDPSPELGGARSRPAKRKGPRHPDNAGGDR